MQRASPNPPLHDGRPGSPADDLVAAVCLAVAVLLSGTAPVAAQEAQPPDGPAGCGAAEPCVRAVPVDTAPRLDGDLGDAVWLRAEPATGFVQREPAVGEPATEATEVRLLHDGTTLFIGIRALDAEPDAVIARQMRRDGRLPDDDAVEVVLDTFHDHRSAFLFGTNANGILVDAMIRDEGRARNFSWDGVWEVAARRTAEGWAAEMAIPASTLRFEPGVDLWGINVRRLIRRKDEEAYWAPVGRDADLFRVSRAGHLTGVAGLRPGTRLRVKPFALGSLERGPGVADDWVGEVGGDLRWEVARGVVLDATLNTDFAQVEADELRTNLTRFPLFFPEKREFFLENAGLFEFGDLAGDFGPPVFRAFFSRRIGIDPRGREVPLLAGARLTGRAGGWSFGLLDVQTRAAGVSGPRGDREEIPADNWAVARLERDLGERSAVGMIFTNRRQQGGHGNRLLGFDVDLSPHPQLDIGGFWARTWTPDRVGGDDEAFGGRARWRSSVLSAGFDFLEIGREFRPEAGFLLRRGVRRFFPDVFVEPRPDWPGIRNLFLGVRADVFTGRDGVLESVNAVLNAPGFQLDSGDYVESFFTASYERLDAPFEIHPGVVLPPGEYEFRDAGIFYMTDPSRSLSASGVVALGEFYDGDRLRVFANVGSRIGRHLALRTQLNHDRVRLPAGDFDATVVRQRIDVAFGPRMFLESLVQYDAARDLLAANVRYRWTYRPGADLFVVLDGADVVDDPLRVAPRDLDAWALIVKFTYLWMP